MSVRLVPTGFGSYVDAKKIVAIATLKSAPVKRSIQEAKARERVIDLTNGRRTKTVIFLTSGHVALSAMEPVTIGGRISLPLLKEGQYDE